MLTRGLDENGELRDAIAHPDNFKDSPLGQIPKHWEVKALDQILTGIDAGKSPDCPDIPAQSDEWGVLKVSAVHPNGFRAEENKVITNPSYINPAYEVQDGNLLITRANTYELVGLTCFVKNPPHRLLLSDKTLRLNVNSNLAFVQFVFYALQMPFVRRQIENNATGSSAGMKNISQKIIRNLLKIAIQVSDIGLPKVITYLRYLKAWEYLDEACQTKAKNLIEKVDSTASVPVLIDALNVVELQAIALERVKHLPPDLIIQNFQTELPPEYMQPVVKDHIQSKVEVFIQSSSFREAATNGRALLQLTTLLNTEQLEIILDAFCHNNQINEALGIHEIMQEIFNKTVYLTESVESLKTKWAFLRQLIDSEQFDGVTSITALKELIDLKFPNLVLLSSTDGTGINS